MNLALAPEIERSIRDGVESGRYPTAEDVIAAALAVLDSQERAAEFDPGELDRLIAEGEADVERGDVLDGDEAFRLRRATRAHARAQGRAHGTP